MPEFKERPKSGRQKAARPGTALPKQAVRQRSRWNGAGDGLWKNWLEQQIQPDFYEGKKTSPRRDTPQMTPPDQTSLSMLSGQRNANHGPMHPRSGKQGSTSPRQADRQLTALLPSGLPMNRQLSAIPTKPDQHRPHSL